ncbi:MAG: flagellar hook protein [Actinomycetota bacterium]|nr:flagellar hook protein [Actinomycetota bacterium]
MSLVRVTQRMMAGHALSGLQTSLAQLATTQEQLSTGRILNRPSDSPNDTGAAMRLSSGIASSQQYQRNAADGLGWLGQVDNALESAGSQLLHAQDVVTQGANAATLGSSARSALAAQIDQLRTGMIDAANTTYLDRPVFGGVTAGRRAYDATGAFVGTPGEVNRAVSDGVRVRVDVDASSAFGPAGSTVFDHLSDASAALRTGDMAGVQSALTSIQADFRRLTDARALAGSSYNRIDTANQAAGAHELQLKTSLSGVQDTDLPKAAVDLQMRTMAYQAALGATSKALQPSLMDYLR